MDNTTFIEDDACMSQFLTAENFRKRSLVAFEEDFDFKGQILWVRNNMAVAYTSVGAYLLFLALGPRLMHNRKSMELRLPLFLWNANLALLSIMASLRVTPEMVDLLRHHGFTYAVCGMSSVGHWRSIGVWSWLYAWSKVVELGDTVFIVLRKRKLIFLHCFHHVTVLLSVWYGYGNADVLGRWYLWLNFLMHAFMYSYYALRALDVPLPKMVSMAITSAQMLQLLIIFGANMQATTVKLRGDTCCVGWTTLNLGLLLSTTYLLLFLNFFIRTYFQRGTGKTSKKLE